MGWCVTIEFTRGFFGLSERVFLAESLAFLNYYMVSYMVRFL